MVWAGAETSAIVGNPGPDLKSDTDNILRLDDSTDTLTIHSLTFDSSKNPVTLTLVASTTVLTINGTSPTSGVQIAKSGEFDSAIVGGRLATTLSGYSVFVNDGLLTIQSAMTGATKTLTLSGAGTLELASTSSSHTIEGGIFVNSGTLRITNDLNLGGGKTASSNFVDLRGGDFEIYNSAVTYGAARVINVDRGGGSIVTTGATSALNILGDNQLVGGTLGTLDKSGAGRLVIGGLNNYSGQVTVSQGTLELQQPGSLGVDNKSAIQLGGSAVLDLNTSADVRNFNNGITLVGSAAINVESATSGGNFLLSTLTAPVGAAPPTLTVTNTSRDGSVLHFTGGVGLGNDLTVNTASGAAVALDGSIQGSAGLTKTGNGTLFINGAQDNRFSKPVIANGGTLALAKTGGALAVPSDLTINGGIVRLDLNNQIGDSSAVSIGAGTLNVNGRTDSVSTLTISGGNLTTGVGGRLFLTLPAGAALPSAIPDGPLAAGATPSLVISGGTTTVNTGGEINATTVQVSGGVNTVQAGGLFTMGSGGLTLTGIASPNITFVSDGANPGRLSLSGNVTYTGTAGMASLTSTGALPLGGTIDLNGAQRDFSVGDDGTSAVDMLVSANITNGSLKKSGAGTLRLTGNNTYTGVSISAGALEIGSPTALGGGVLTLGAGQLSIRSDVNNTIISNAMAVTGDVTLSIDRDTVGGGTSGNVFMSGPMTIPANQLMITGANRTAIFNGTTTLTGTAKINTFTTALDVNMTGPIGQSGGIWGLTKDGVGKLTLDGTQPNTYTGSTRVQNGTLALNKTPGINAVPANLDVLVGGTARLMASNQIIDTSAVTVNIGGTLDLNGQTETIASLGGTGGSITLGGGTLTVTQGTTPAAISGSGMVVQENPAGGTSAVLTLSGQNTFTGGVIVNHGQVNFSQQAPGHSGTTLQGGGIWRVFNGSSLNFNAGSNITTNNAEVVLNGAASSFAKINSLANNGGTFTIAGGKTFTAAGALSNSGTLTVGAGSTLTVNNNFTNSGNALFTGAIVGAGVMSSSGNLTISGTQTYTAGTSMNVTGGTTVFNSDAGAPNTYRLSINQTGGGLQLGGVQHLANLTLSGTAVVGTGTGAAVPADPLPGGPVMSGAAVLVTQAISTSGAGTLDLANNALVVDYNGAATPFDAVRTAILLGYNSPGTRWAGHGITSSTALANADAYGVGYSEASSALGISGAQTASFRGQTVDATSVLARFTRLGDANLDGSVDFLDLAKLAQNYNAAGTTWSGGDFNYDGTTDFNDLAKLAQNYNTALPSDAIPGASLGFEQDLARAFAEAPEPSALLAAGMIAAGTMLCGRRRRPRHAA
jgi:autotransporter-associated beta strand protein